MRRLFQDLRTKRDSKLTYLAAWIASFVRVPCYGQQFRFLKLLDCGSL